MVNFSCLCQDNSQISIFCPDFSLEFQFLGSNAFLASQLRHVRLSPSKPNSIPMVPALPGVVLLSVNGSSSLLGSQVINLSSPLMSSSFSHHTPNPSINSVGFTYKTHPESSYQLPWSRSPPSPLGLWSLIYPSLPSGTFSSNNQSNSIGKCQSDHVILVMKIFQVASHLIHLKTKYSAWSV